MLNDDITTLYDSARLPPSSGRIRQHADRTSMKQPANADVILALLRGIARESDGAEAAGRALSSGCAAVHTVECLTIMRKLAHSWNLVSQIARLRSLVLEFDEGIAGDKMSSLAELAVRSQTLAILLFLDELCDAMIGRSPLFRDLFTGSLKAIDDLVWRVFDSLGRINKPWLRHAVDPCALTANGSQNAFDVTSTLRYRAVRQAQKAIAGIAAEPDIAHFLRVGSSRTDVPRVRRVCRQLADVLCLAPIKEPDRELFLVAVTLGLDEIFYLRGSDDIAQ
jgi:hypothetical protein